MKSHTLGKRTLEAEVTNLDRHGLWVLVREEEFFLPFVDFPWFEGARVSAVLNVRLLHENHLHWPEFDIDLTVESLRNLARYPLIWEPSS